jgi:hypothetical protein
MDGRWWLAVIVVCFGLLVILCSVRFGMQLSGGWKGAQDDPLYRLMEYILRTGQPRPISISQWSAAFEEYLSRRNEFWTLFGQIGLSVVLVVVLAVLLLAGVITPEAGLPILSGIGGFAIGKTVQATRGSNSSRSAHE